MPVILGEVFLHTVCIIGYIRPCILLSIEPYPLNVCQPYVLSVPCFQGSTSPFFPLRKVKHPCIGMAQLRSVKRVQEPYNPLLDRKNRGVAHLRGTVEQVVLVKATKRIFREGSEGLLCEVFGIFVFIIGTYSRNGDAFGDIFNCCWGGHAVFSLCVVLIIWVIAFTKLKMHLFFWTSNLGAVFYWKELLACFICTNRILKTPSYPTTFWIIGTSNSSSLYELALSCTRFTVLPCCTVKVLITVYELHEVWLANA